MKIGVLLFVLALLNSCSFGQTFTRSELPADLSTPWEIQYGPDTMLWLTESGGRVSRVDPVSGVKTVVYTALDYFTGDPSETNSNCGPLPIGFGTLGLAMHPDFLNPQNAYIYYMYSYNYGTAAAPETRFKIKRIKWDAISQTIVSDTTVVAGISNGYDHWGGRLLIVNQAGIPYLFVSVGDHGSSEDDDPSCYQPQSLNPNNHAQDPAYDNGKIHRFHLDGSIPADNPIAGNSFYTRGHRNPQGLMYHPDLHILYDIEHGDRTDDEINILEKGMNYGWKNVRGYHTDNNYPGEADYITNYVPNPQISNDHLVEPFYSFCATIQSTDPNYLSWCTVAPSDGIYYGSTAIPEWTNSLLVVTLKNGTTTDMEVYQFQLDSNGNLVPATSSNPNPKRFFGTDQELNGRLRDIAISPDGKIIYLVNNGGATSNTDKITVYTYDEVITPGSNGNDVVLFPNPAYDNVLIQSTSSAGFTYTIADLNGRVILESASLLEPVSVDISDWLQGMYFVHVVQEDKTYLLRLVKL